MGHDERDRDFEIERDGIPYGVPLKIPSRFQSRQIWKTGIRDRGPVKSRRDPESRRPLFIIKIN